MRLLLLLAMTVAVPLPGCTPSGSDPVVSLDEGTIRYADEVPQKAELPDYWRPDRRLKHQEATYELSPDLDEATDELWAVFLARLAMNAGPRQRLLHR
ncbi:MAG: hypothetical protein P8R42_09860 [Candidatus Binatia bacterium]|nr:hypothetical protein [Candidatus Binatia bacterium]